MPVIGIIRRNETAASQAKPRRREFNHEMHECYESSILSASTDVPRPRERERVAQPGEGRRKKANCCGEETGEVSNFFYPQMAA
jgi:hypothetical protein